MLLIWVIGRKEETQGESPGPSASASGDAGSSVRPAKNNILSPSEKKVSSEEEIPGDPRVQRLANGFVNYMPAIEASKELNTKGSVEQHVSIVSRLLDHYRYAYKENPVGGENSEITKQLTGGNPMKIVFVDSASEALVGNELVDTWGSPYFFHAESSQKMEVISAGPDLEMWTDDDISSED